MDLFIGQQVTDSQQVVSLVNAPIVVVILFRMDVDQGFFFMKFENWLTTDFLKVDYCTNQLR